MNLTPSLIVLMNYDIELSFQIMQLCMYIALFCFLNRRFSSAFLRFWQCKNTSRGNPKLKIMYIDLEGSPFTTRFYYFNYAPYLISGTIQPCFWRNSFPKYSILFLFTNKSLLPIRLDDFTCTVIAPLLPTLSNSKITSSTNG